MSDRIFNFSAGPAILPEDVLKEAQADLFNYKGSGMSVMEMSHRSKTYDEIITTTEKDIRKLLDIGDNYSVLFSTGWSNSSIFYDTYEFNAACK
jgi:phosphoserine aminotransferase